MPEVVRAELDSHVGHDSPTPSPFHQTSYVAGQTTVFANCWFSVDASAQ